MFRIAGAASFDQQESHVPIMDYFFGSTRPTNCEYGLFHALNMTTHETEMLRSTKVDIHSLNSSLKRSLPFHLCYIYSLQLFNASLLSIELFVAVEKF